MKKEDISEALNDVDFDMVEQAYEKAEKKKKNPWLKWGTLAASLVLIIGAAIALPMLLQDNLPDVPLWDASHFPAERVVPLSNYSMGGGGTTGYTKVYASDNSPLWLNPIPRGRYLRIYERKNVEAEPNKAELQTFADATIPKLADAMGLPRPEYSVESRNEFRVETDTAPYKIEIRQSSLMTYLEIYNASGSDQPMFLDGNPVQVDISLSNEEILESLEPIKKSLFEIFGVSFSDVEIRSASSCSIFFTNESDHYLNEFEAISVMECIHMQFHSNDTDDNILTNVTISYKKPRVDVDELYPLVAKAKRLSLKHAEKLLKKGYSFTREGFCGLCTGTKNGVSFDSYDYVSLEYMFCSMKDGRKLGIPVYAFHKKIETTQKGITVYAKTYVPAIEIEGYEEYIDEIHRFHASRANRS